MYLINACLLVKGYNWAIKGSIFSIKGSIFSFGILSASLLFSWANKIFYKKLDSFVCNIMKSRFKLLLTHTALGLNLYTGGASGFLTFSRGIEKEHWTANNHACCPMFILAKNLNFHKTLLFLTKIFACFFVSSDFIILQTNSDHK